MSSERNVIPTPVGRLEIVTRDGRLRELSFTTAKPTRAAAYGPLGSDLTRYLSGESTDFADVALDLDGATPFERCVYEATKRVPFGKVATYGQIARAIGKPKASRAVGQALGKNPIAIVIPCHRIISSDGGLGGFSAGLPYKRKLLRLEGVLR
jgi:methylated-DNA-[protein]-cysteine S-methyltransferase